MNEFEKQEEFQSNSAAGENPKQPQTEKFEKKYSERKFNNKLVRFAVKAGERLIEQALVMYYTLRDKDTPMKSKAIIMGALGYFIAPLDLIPDITPVVGFTDDYMALVGALGMVVLHIKEDHRLAAREKIDKLFGLGG
jgi:uncharacterized membrane protein YkvA (DUF1232 family)